MRMHLYKRPLPSLTPSQDPVKCDGTPAAWSHMPSHKHAHTHIHPHTHTHTDLEKGGGDKHRDLVPIDGVALVQLLAQVAHGAHVGTAPKDADRGRALGEQLQQHRLKNKTLNQQESNTYEYIY